MSGLSLRAMIDLAAVFENFRLESFQQTETFPAVVEGFVDAGFEAPCLVRPRSPAATAFAIDDMISGWLCFRLASGGHWRVSRSFGTQLSV